MTAKAPSDEPIGSSYGPDFTEEEKACFAEVVEGLMAEGVGEECIHHREVSASLVEYSASFRSTFFNRLLL